MRKLIITGDDFGAAVSVNEAIEIAHRSGILNTASLMVGGAAVTDAVSRAKRMPKLRVGLHVVVVDGRPLLDPRDVPALVDEDGECPRALLRSGLSFFFDPAARRQLAMEIRAQFEAFRRLGLALDHVNAHNHMHVHPTVLRLILDIGRDYGAAPLRVPYEPLVPSWQAGRDDPVGRFGYGVALLPMIGMMRHELRRRGIPANDYLFGVIDTGRMTAARVLSYLEHLPQGVSEMHFHPATSRWPGMPAEARCEEELAALTDPQTKDAIGRLGIAMTSFGELCAA